MVASTAKFTGGTRGPKPGRNRDSRIVSGFLIWAYKALQTWILFRFVDIRRTGGYLSSTAIVLKAKPRHGSFLIPRSPRSSQ